MGELWSFSPSFYPTELWAQRSVLKLCLDTPADLRILEKHCWVLDFKDWMIARGDRYPVPPDDFETLVYEYANENKEVGKYLWIRGGKIKGWYATFDLNVAENETNE